jgi:hypothetical protein
MEEEEAEQQLVGEAASHQYSPPVDRLFSSVKSAAKAKSTLDLKGMYNVFQDTFQDRLLRYRSYRLVTSAVPFRETSLLLPPITVPILLLLRSLFPKRSRGRNRRLQLLRKVLMKGTRDCRNQRMFGEMNAITVEKIKKNRPKNTTKIYNAPQKAWAKFCKDKRFDGSDHVSSDKLIWFLHEIVLSKRVLPAEKKASKRDRKAAEEEEGQGGLVESDERLTNDICEEVVQTYEDS